MIEIIWVVRMLVILMIARYVIALFTRRMPASGPQTRRTGRKPAERTGGTLVRDPQCGTYVPESTALALTRSGATVHFCSTTCRDAWALAHPR